MNNTLFHQCLCPHLQPLSTKVDIGELRLHSAQRSRYRPIMLNVSPNKSGICSFHCDDVTCLCTAARVVAVSRRAEGLTDLRQKLGNPSGDKLVTVQGNLCEQPGCDVHYRNATVLCVYFTFADFASAYSIANKRSQQLKCLLERLLVLLLTLNMRTV